MIRNRNRAAGFTLVEMLTVIAIIVLLAGLLLPAVAEAQRRIHSQASRAQIRNIETAVNAYYGDWKFYPASGSGIPTTFASSGSPFTGAFTNSDGAAALYRGICANFQLPGSSMTYGRYYNPNDDELSTSLNTTWGVNPPNNGLYYPAGGTPPLYPYIIDRIPPGMPILYVRTNPGRQFASEILPFEHTQLTNVRPGVTLAAHTAPTGGSPWSANAASPTPTATGVTGGKSNFFFTPARAPTPDGTPWGSDFPRWSAMGADNRAAMEGKFLLVSPGLDRKYGTRDDVRNYETQ
jgi:general secretion pathway protein G